MMKCFIIFAVIVGAAFADNLTDEEQQKIQDLHTICLKENDLDEEITRAALDGNFADNPKFNSYLTCFNKNMGFMDSSGRLQMDIIKEHLEKLLGDKAKGDETASKCVVEKGSIEETSFEMAKCIFSANKDLL